MSVEQAIINFVVTGAEGASAAADRVEVDLRSVETAGKAASTAANEASRAAAEMTATARQAVAGLSRAVSLARQLAEFSGNSAAAGAVNVFGQGLQVGAQGLALGAQLAGPVGAAIGFAGGSILGVANALADQEKRDNELAKKIAKENARLRDENLEDQLLQQYGLVKLGGSIRSESRSAQ